MSIIEKMTKIVNDGDSAGAEQLIHDDYQFLMHSSGKSLTKKDVVGWVGMKDVKKSNISPDFKIRRTLLKKYAHLQKHVIAPVWHMNLSIEWLLEIADNYPRFCFGSSGQYWQVGSESWCRRSDQAWNELLKRGRLHIGLEDCSLSHIELLRPIFFI